MTPRPFLLWTAAGLTPLLALGIWAPPLAAAGILGNMLLLALALADALATPSSRKVHIVREVAEVLSVGTRNPVALVATNKSRFPLHVELADSPPVPSSVSVPFLAIDLPPWKERSASYHVEPKRRGRNLFTSVHIRFKSLFGFWTVVEKRRLENPVRIYPDIKAVHRFDLLSRKNRLEEMGLKIWRIRGQGGEFERLREYRFEDEMRHVDWKATSKKQKLISREYTVERNQNILILLDCGRSMRLETDGISHLDRGLNASIILSYIALGQGDNVGLLAFSNRIERAVGPVRGKPAIQTIIQGTFDLEPRGESSDYGMAWEEMQRRQRKRALVVLLTHALDESHILAIATYARTRTLNHLVLCVFLKDVGLVELAETVPRDDVEAFRVAAAAEILSQQAKHVDDLREAGVLVLETLPQKLSADVINEYLDLKARHLL